MKAVRILLALWCVPLILSACSISSADAPLQTPTNNSELTQTLAALESSVQKTVEFRISQTAAAQPTLTSIPTATSTPLPTATSTATQPAATRTATKILAECIFISQAPRAKTEFGKGEDFDYHAKFYNNGGNTWDKDEVEFRYLSGVEMHKFTNKIPLTEDVKPGETIEFLVDMRTPSDTGNFTAIWGLMQGSKMLCASMVDINTR